MLTEFKYSPKKRGSLEAETIQQSKEGVKKKGTEQKLTRKNQMEAKLLKSKHETGKLL